MNPSLNSSLGFPFGTNQSNTTTSATATPTPGFSFGSSVPTAAGFNFASTTAATKPGFSFSASNANAGTPVFGNPGTTLGGFGAPNTNATGSQPFVSGPGSGLFGGIFVQSASQPTPQTGFLAAPATTQSTGFFSGRMPTATTGASSQPGGNTTLFSGFAHPGSTPSFGFSSPAPSPQSGGITFGTPKSATQGSAVSTKAQTFGSVTPSLNTRQTGLSFPSQETVAKPGFSFVATTSAALSGSTPGFGTTQTASSGGISFGVPASASMTKPGVTTTSATNGVSTGLMQGGTTAAVTQLESSGPGFKLGGAPATTVQTAAVTQQGSSGTGFKLGGAPATTVQTAPGFTFGGASTAPGSTLASGTTLTSGTTLASGTTLTSTATPASKELTQPVQSLPLGQSTTGFNFSGQLAVPAKTPGKTTTTSSMAKPTSTVGSNQNLVFAARVNSTIGPGAFPTPTATTSTAKSTFGSKLPLTSTGSNLGGTPTSGFGTTTTTATNGAFKLPPSATVASSTGKAATSGTTTATTSTTSSEKYTYKQLEDQVNKWNIELEDMEKTFLEQAAQVNVADRELMENGEKIAVLYNEVERAKSEQNRLDQELDFLVSQQNELEDLLKPLEESVKQHSTDYSQEPDREREKIYTMAENCDAQLKGMVQDLKEVIDYLNASNANQQQEDNPVVQIAKILNVHMDSLQWIDQNSALLQKRVDEISRLSDVRRKDHERSFRLDFD